MRFVSSGTEAAMSAVRVARAATEARQDRQVRRLLSRTRGRLPGEGRIGRDDARRADEPGRPGRRRRPTRCSRATTISTRSSAVIDGNRGQIAAIIVEPIAGNMGLVPPRDGFLAGLRAICDREQALLVFDEVISGFRAAARRRPAGVRRPAGPDVPRQDHRRRAAGRGLRRPRRRDGAGRAGRTRVSGGDAVGQSAGDDRRAVVARNSCRPGCTGTSPGSARSWPRASPTRRALRMCRMQVNAFGSLLTPFFIDRASHRLRVGADRRHRRVRAILQRHAGARHLPAAVAVRSLVPLRRAHASGTWTRRSKRRKEADARW